MHLQFQSNWIYIGTEKGNTYILNIYNNFSQSGYDIKWNNAIELYAVFTLTVFLLFFFWMKILIDLKKKGTKKQARQNSSFKWLPGWFHKNIDWFR